MWSRSLIFIFDRQKLKFRKFFDQKSKADMNKSETNRPKVLYKQLRKYEPNVKFEKFQKTIKSESIKY